MKKKEMREREEYVKLGEFYTKRETTFEDQQGKINVNNYINLVTGSTNPKREFTEWKLERFDLTSSVSDWSDLIQAGA